jgi:hypothetical protein
MARTYVALATGDRNGQGEQSAGDPDTAGAGSQGCAGEIVVTGVTGQVGIITLADRQRHNAIGTQLVNGITAALQPIQS